MYTDCKNMNGMKSKAHHSYSS